MNDRFWSKVSKTDNCWWWTGCLISNGRGQFRFKGRTRLAHRVSWELTYGEIPTGVLVCHSCDNPTCVRPDHLFLGTQKDNILDCVSKNRQAFGSRNGQSKLTDDQVSEIRRMSRVFGWSQRALARLFGVCKGTIQPILEDRTWKN